MDPQQSSAGKGAAYPTKYRRNQPRSKNGCLTCRSKRKKCDEIKPRCTSCIKSNQTCVWPSKDEQESQNSSAASTSDSSPPSMDKLNRKANKSEAKRPVTDAQTSITDLNLAMESLSTSSDAQVFQRFFFDWATSGNISGGYTMSWFANLFKIYTNASVDSLIHKSINAVANASYGQRFNSPDALNKARTWYGKAIQMLKVKLLCTDDSSSYCDVVSAITLLGIYEGLMHESIALEGSCESHMSGASTLLSIRGQDKIIESPAEFEVSAVCFLQMLYSTFLNGQTLPISWTSVNKLALPKLPDFYAHIQLIYEAACQFAEWRTALLDYESDKGLKRLSDVASRAAMLDRRFEEWSQTAPPSLSYTTEPLPAGPYPEWLQPLINNPWRPLNYHTYPTLMVQILWRFYWLSRSIINQALLYTYDILQERKETIDPSFPRRTDIEDSILSFTDMIRESCISTFVGVCKDNPQMEAEQVPTLLGYLILQVLPALGLFYEQITFTTVDIMGRREWAAKMRHFLRVNFGIAKGITAIPPSHVGKIPIQTWGLPDELPRYSK
ncbi:unnamed protein product [Fusarium venenatum]|uniref:Zn(2)-C6 fungal-type domain-containing protein n=1 Tax=Fusarium venenatum TaxID=56646 RepID=A0A2L2U3H4_9HYPO|nr:uncharacterized protein FVRRES_10587 [Fusarium venenatum]CEI70510.1 unnamed protein product [Fusarium venenatum]